MVSKAKQSAKNVKDDISAVAKELAMLDADPTAKVEDIQTKAKTAAKKATDTAKATAKKAGAAVKSVTKKAEKATEKAADEAKKVVKKATAKKDIVKTAVVEYAGNQYLVEDIIARCEAKYKAESKNKSYKDIKVYIKPENNAAYYVVDEKSADKIDLI